MYVPLHGPKWQGFTGASSVAGMKKRKKRVGGGSGRCELTYKNIQSLGKVRRFSTADVDLDSRDGIYRTEINTQIWFRCVRLAAATANAAVWVQLCRTATLCEVAVHTLGGLM